MKISDFDYELDESLIAQDPIEKRDESRLLVLNKNSGNIKHEKFKDIINYLNKGDVLVFNNTKVIPARLYGYKDTSAKIEVLLLKELKKDIYEVLIRPSKRVSVGTKVTFSNELYLEVLKKKNDGLHEVKLNYTKNLYEVLDSIGIMPLPPYIKYDLKDSSRYQTVYAKNIGSAAAPTAGLHFTNEILSKIKEKEVEILYITLHVGLGTFRPVKTNKIKNHKMHSEYYEINDETALRLNKALKEKRKIIAVGTTTLRALESSFKNNVVNSSKNNTEIFIYPGYKFNVVNELITNFHLPKSTLLMLVSALAGTENIMKAYKEAIEKRYRFFSFGDAMFIKNK